MFKKRKKRSKKTRKRRGERRGKKRKGRRRKKKRKKKRRDSPYPGGSDFSHFKGGFPKVLREWVPGFEGKKEGRQMGSSRESYKYERCVLLPFLLRLSLPLMFAA